MEVFKTKAFIIEDAVSTCNTLIESNSNYLNKKMFELQRLQRQQNHLRGVCACANNQLELHCESPKRRNF